MTANEVLARAMAADVGDLADDEHNRLSVEAALGELKRRGHVLAAQTAQLELVARLAGGAIAGCSIRDPTRDRASRGPAA